MESSSARFHYRLHTLPQELYDQIYSLTFAATPSVRTLGCDDSHQGKLPADPMPHLLAVDNESRVQFAKSYYNNTTFVAYGHSSLIDWLELLPIDHRHFLKDIRMIYIMCDSPANRVKAALYVGWYEQSGQQQMRDAFGDGVMDIVQSGHENEITKDLEGFIKSSERIAAAQTALSSPVHKALKNRYRIHKLQKCFRARFRR